MLQKSSDKPQQNTLSNLPVAILNSYHDINDSFRKIYISSYTIIIEIVIF